MREYGPDGKQLVMPGFASVETPSPALPLALYDLGAGPTISPGRGAPLALRMFVESVAERAHARAGKGSASGDVGFTAGVSEMAVSNPHSQPC